MKICPACQQTNPDDAGVCQVCSYALTPNQGASPTQLASDATAGYYESGEVFADRYRIEKELGRGGMGVVYLAADLELREKRVALKLIHPDILSNPEALQRFQDEVMTCQALRHPCIVQVYDLKRCGEQRFYAMEYIPGRSLRDEILSRRDKTPPFALDEAAAIILPLLKALAYAHARKIIHRDIKPENVILVGALPEINIKVVDFGIAKTLSVSRMTSMAQSLGTAYYMAPEQLAGKPVDLRADLYSVGMMLYELLTGEIAMGMAEPPSAFNSELPKEIDGLVSRLLKRFSEQRYADADQAFEALEIIVRRSTKPTIEKTTDEDRKSEETSAKKPAENPLSNQSREKVEEAARKPKKTKFTNSLGMDFVWINPGTFMMGSPEEEKGRFSDEALHEVNLTTGFFMQTTPVTVGNWRRFFKATGYYTEAEKKGGTKIHNGREWADKTSASWDRPGFKQTDNHPVTCVSYNDVQAFIRWINQNDEDHYCLPTEAQWEYAARAGSKTCFFFGSDRNQLDNYVWFNRNANYGTQAIGQKKPNPWGLYDILGNVYEWCEDWYGVYPSGAVTDPGKQDGFVRVARGGCWFNGAGAARCAYRFKKEPGFWGPILGLRLVRKS